MALLQRIRNRAGLLVGALGLALLAFILSDVFTSSNTIFNRFKDKAFTVNGVVVSTGEYEKRIEEYESFRQFLYGSSQDDNKSVENREKIYREMVDEMIVQEEAARLGLTVTSGELSDLVYGTRVSSIFFSDNEISQMFRNPQTGQFDQGILTYFVSSIKEEQPEGLPEQQKAYLEQANEAWQYIESRIKTQRLREKYLSLVGSTILVNDAEAKIAYEDGKSTADFAYVMQPYTSISDSSVSVSDSEIKALYEKRKNNFKLASDLRKISYFTKDILPSDADYASVKKVMDEATEKLNIASDPAIVINEYSSVPYMNAYIAVSSLPLEVRNFVTSSKIGDVLGPVMSGQAYVTYKYVDRVVAPDSIRLQRISMPGGFDQNVVNTIADSLLNVIKKGKSFAVVANELDPQSNGGDVGWATEAQLSMLDINKECFAARTGDVFKLNVHGETWLARVSEKTKPVEKVKIAVINMPVIVSDKTQNSIDNELNQFISENNNVETFEKVAEAKGYGLVSDAMLAPSFVGLDQTDANTRNIIHWAFNSKIGDVRKFDYADKKIVAIIKSEITGKYLPISEPAFSDMLKEELIRDKKAEKIIEDLKTKNLTSLDAYSVAMDAKEETVNFVSFNTRTLTLGYEPLFNVYAKHGTLNQLVAPLKGELGVYALSITGKSENIKDFDSKEIKELLAQESVRAIYQGTIYALRDKMDVKDNRITFW